MLKNLYTCIDYVNNQIFPRKNRLNEKNYFFEMVNCMDKVKLGKDVHVNPMAVTLLGTKVQGKDNFMILGWVTRINLDPPMLALGINNA